MNSSYTPLAAIVAGVLGLAFFAVQGDGDENSPDRSLATQGSTGISSDTGGAPAQSPEPSHPGPFSLGLGFGHGERTRQPEQPRTPDLISDSKDTSASRPADARSVPTDDSEQVDSKAADSTKTAPDADGARTRPLLPLGMGFGRADQSARSEPRQAPAPATGSTEEPGPIEEAWDKTKEVASDAMQDAKEAAGDVIEDTEEAAGDAVQDAKDFASDVIQDTKEVTSDVIQDTEEAAGDAMRDAKEIASDVMRKVKEVAGDAMEAISSDADADAGKDDGTQAGQTGVERVWEEVKEAGAEAAEIFTGEDAAEKAQPR